MLIGQAGTPGRARVELKDLVGDAPAPAASEAQEAKPGTATTLADKPAKAAAAGNKKFEF